MIDTLTINSDPVDPCMVLGTVIILHGRRTVADGPTASSATVTIYHPPGTMPTWSGGDVLALSGPDGVLFTGRITERSLAHEIDNDGTTWGAFTVTAMGTVARLGVRQVGDEPWPAESGADRATHILTAAVGVEWFSIDGDTDVLVLPRDVDATDALTLLTGLQATTMAAVFDRPDGVVIYQALSGRNRPVFPFRWQDFDPGETWDDFDTFLTWAGTPPSMEDWDSPASERPLDLPCTAVQWEPEWLATEAAVINHVRVGWGPTPEGGVQPTVELQDTASQTRHGRRYHYEGTDLANEASALKRAGHIITTQARERWALSDVVVFLDQLDPFLRADALALLCGDHVTLKDLPQPAPAIEWTGILEGWTYTQWNPAPGTVNSTLTLALSDPLWSLAVITWADYPTTYRWDEHPAHITWDDLTTLDILEATP